MSDTNRLAERAVLAAIIAGCAAKGFVPVAVYDGEDYLVPGIGSGTTRCTSVARETPRRALTIDDCLEVIYSVDDISTVHFANVDNLANWGRTGVAVIPGNGRDFAHDWHDSKDTGFGAAVWDAIKDL